MEHPTPQLRPCPPVAADMGQTRALYPGGTPRIFRDHAAFVASVAFKLMGRADELDDIVQDVFLAAFRGIANLRDPGAIRPWLAAITVRFARRRLHARKLRRWCGFDDLPDYEEIAATGASPEERALLAQIYAILDALPVDQRMAWCLRHIHGYALEDVAAASGCSLATAKRRIAAAHARLEEAVNGAVNDA